MQTGTTCGLNEWRLMDHVRVTLHEICLVVHLVPFWGCLGSHFKSQLQSGRPNTRPSEKVSEGREQHCGELVEVVAYREPPLPPLLEFLLFLSRGPLLLLPLSVTSNPACS